MWDEWDEWDEPRPIPAEPTPEQRIADLEAHLAALQEMFDFTRRDLVQAMGMLESLKDRATNAEDALEKLRERAQALYEAIYRGKIARAEDILSALDPIVHG